MGFLQIYSIIFSSIWVLLLVALAWTLIKVPLFHEETDGLPESLEHWPRLSIIIPACNEADSIESAIQSILDQDYPNLELIAVNDRSTDNTGEILKLLADQDARVTYLQIDELPSGWLGKVNALNQGVTQATGEWLLFTDADIYYAPGILKRAIIFAQKKQINHLALLPSIIKSSFWLDVSITSFGLMFLLSSRAAMVNNTKGNIPIGVGAFNMVQTETFNKTPGFDWLRLEPGDDYCLGVMINNSGGRTHFAFATEDLSVPWYASLTEMFRGLEKNMFGPGAHYSVLRMMYLVISLWALFAAPAVALTIGIMMESTPVLIAGITAIASHAIFSIYFSDKNDTKILQLLLFPIGIMIFSLMFLWSGYQCIKNGGINWRGTHYTLKELRAGQRVKF